MKIRVNIDIKVGRLVKYFILSDLALLSGWGLIEPVFSVFIIQKVAGATLITVGIAAAIYWILRALIQLPLANYIDRTPGEKDDFYALILGLLIAAFSSILFVLVNQAWQLYAVQALHAMGFAFYGTAWPAIFSRHLDKDRISFDWALDSTAISIAAGISGFLGGVIATWLGFPAVFILTGLLSVVAAAILIMAPELILPKKTVGDPILSKEGARTKVPMP
jgi:MFS family permease